MESVMLMYPYIMIEEMPSDASLRHFGMRLCAASWNVAQLIWNGGCKNRPTSKVDLIPA
jgi:hypothetical protein